jgi:membrane protease YdiL (CAAX protease family)
LVLAGIVATILAGGLLRLGEASQIVGAKPLVEISIAVILFRVFPETNLAPWTIKRTAVLMALGSGLSLFWILAFAWGRTRFPDLPKGSEFALFVGLTSAIVTAPIFEEKLVRHLILQGGARLTNAWISTFFVSIAFAFAHQHAVIWSFLVSLVLCWLALEKGAGTLQRALAHGTINSLVMLWYLTKGFGFFS